MSKKKVNLKKTTPPKTQNGKGDAPRNISEKFKSNYEKIKWNKK